METYKVVIEEVRTYTEEVEAKSAVEAKQKILDGGFDESYYDCDWNIVKITNTGGE